MRRACIYVVGVDFELGLRVDLGVVREEEVPVRLLGVRFLGVLVHNNPAVEYAPRPPVENAVIELPAVAVRALVLDLHVVVHVLASRGHVEAVYERVAPLAAEDGVDVVPYERAAEED